jgi:hypothetical protein
LENIEFVFAVNRSLVITQHSGKGIMFLICKGGDDLICQKFDRIFSIKRYNQKFPQDGLSILCCISFELSDEYFSEWNIRLRMASAAIHNRKRKIMMILQNQKRIYFLFQNARLKISFKMMFLKSLNLNLKQIKYLSY